jgi:DTW domain-containing protein YfiP
LRRKLSIFFFLLLSIKHEQELDSKSTAIHAKLLAPCQTELHNFHKQAPASSALATRILNSPPGSFVILFPDADAVQLHELPSEELEAIQAVIVIDGTWSQAAAINRTAPFCSLRKIRIDPHLQTVFWRYQALGLHCLSTIEAIYYFMREMARIRSSDLEATRLDDLLYFFSFFYHLIQDSYLTNPGRKYTTKHRSDYIQRIE